MYRSYLLSAATAAVLLAGGSAVQAELIYGFNDAGINGFTKSYDQDSTASISQSTTTGVSEGTGALHLAVGPTGGGFDQIDLAAGSVPASLIAPGANALSLTAAANYNNAAYITLAPAFFIDGVNNNGTAFGTKLIGSGSAQFKTIPYDGGVATTRTYTFTPTYKDPYATAQPGLNADGHTTTGLYTAGDIVAALLAANPIATAAVDGFALEVTTNTQPDPNLPDLGIDLFVDNVSVTPEPTSLAALGLVGLLAARRRSR